MTLNRAAAYMARIARRMIFDNVRFFVLVPKEHACTISCVTDYYESRLIRLLVIETSIIAPDQLGLYLSNVSGIYIYINSRHKQGVDTELPLFLVVVKHHSNGNSQIVWRTFWKMWLTYTSLNTREIGNTNVSFFLGAPSRPQIIYFYQNSSTVKLRRT